MPNQNTGPAFGGQDYNGPFSEQLRPPEPTPIAVPGAKIPRQAAAAAIIDKFLDGLQRGRQQQFQQEQNQISQKRNALTSAYNQIQQDYAEGRVTAEGAAKAKQIYTNAMAGIALSDLDHGDDQAGKKSKKKDGDQPQTAGQQVKGFAKQLLTNVVGKQPGGAVDPGSAMLAMQQAVYAKDGNPLPQYNAKSQVADIQNKIQQTQGGIPADATWNLAQPHFGPMLDKLRFLNPQEADRKEKELRELYAPTPTPPPPGSVEDARLQAQRLFTSVPQGQPGASAPPGAPTVTPQATGGPPPINGRQFSALRSAGMVTKESNIEYTGPDGKKIQGEGVRANVPNHGEFWYVRDASGNLQPVNQQGVREVGTGQQQTDPKPSEPVRIGPNQKDAFGQPIPAGASGRWMTINGNTGWYLSNQSGPQARAESAQRLYKEINGIPLEKELTAEQDAKAQEQWVIATDPAKKAKYSGATSGKALNKVANDNPLFDIQAWDFLTKGTFDVRGIGKDAGQAAEQITARAQQIMRDNGLTAGDVIALRAGVKADTGALARVTTQGATVNQLEDQLSKNMAIAKKLDGAFKRSDTPFVNKVITAFNTGTGDSEALNLAAQLHAVSREWAKLMQGQTSAAGVSIKEAAETDKLISSSMSSGQLTSLLIRSSLKTPPRDRRRSLMSASGSSIPFVARLRPLDLAIRQIKLTPTTRLSNRTQATICLGFSITPALALRVQ